MSGRSERSPRPPEHTLTATGMSTREERVYTGMIGSSKYDLDTPVLLVGIDRMERNIARMTDVCRRAGVNWRPHTKGQKVPAIAHIEIAAGAIGVTCAKLGEAEVMAAAGVKDILIANQIVGPIKVARYVNLCRRADVIVAVDCIENVRELDAAAREKGVRPRVVVEVNVGMDRCGVLPGDPVVALSRLVAASEGLRYAGLMGWEGHTMAMPDSPEKRQAVEKAMGLLTMSAQKCREAGLTVEIVSCGGSGTFMISAWIPGITEVQAGGGIFNDLVYAGAGLKHEFALTVLATVTSRPAPDRIVVDAGFKVMSGNVAVPRLIDVPDVESLRLHAEHGVITLGKPAESPRVGEKVEFIVGYGDSTVTLHNEMWGVRNDRLEVVWPILGRGKFR